MKRRPFHDPDRDGGGRVAASAQTVADLALVEAELAAAEAARARAVAALARVRGRGDGEAAVGMPVEQWLRSVANLHRAVLSGIDVLLDVWNDLPTVRDALTSGTVTLDQAVAVARETARVGRDLRLEVDAALDAEPHWTRWPPDLVTANVARLLDELCPTQAVQRERSAAERQWLAIQPTLDGQGVRWWGEYEGVDAALFDASLLAASDCPKAGVPRARQRAQGLARILRDWATGGHDPGNGGSPVTPDVTIHLLVEEASVSDGHAATVLSRTNGFAPRLTADAMGRLTSDNDRARTITTFTRQGVPVSISGRAGHAVDDPAALSEKSTRELVRLRDGVCAAPGCTSPIDDHHHIVWRIHGGRDDPSNRVGLCKRCHHRIAHDRRWTIEVLPDATIAWTRGDHTHTVPPRQRRVLRRGARDSDEDSAARSARVDLDQYGDPLPF